MTTLVDSDGLKHFKTKTDAAYLSKTGTAVKATTAERCTGNADTATKLSAAITWGNAAGK